MGVNAMSVHGLTRWGERRNAYDEGSSARRRRGLMGLLAMAVIGSLGAPAPALASSQARAVSSSLSGVSATSASDAWSVGVTTTGAVTATLIRHWDGATWTDVPSPNPGHGGALQGVGAVSASDAWAVGSYQASTGSKTLVEHWDGTAWTKVPSPDPVSGSPTLTLSGVSASSGTDAWAVGYYLNQAGTAIKGLIEHWDGHVWTVQPSPRVHGNVTLTGVSAASSKDAWAVGSGPRFTGLTEHWDGKRWTIVPNPSPGGASSSSVLEGVSVVGATDAWAVGVVDHDQETTFTTLTERWNGKSWTRVPSPSPGTSDSQLLAVSALSASDAWAVGHFDSPAGYRSLIEHWDGSAWTTVPSPSPGGAKGSNLSGASAVTSSDAWVVGDYDSAPSASLTEHWNGRRWVRS